MGYSAHPPSYTSNNTTTTTTTLWLRPRTCYCSFGKEGLTFTTETVLVSTVVLGRLPLGGGGDKLRAHMVKLTFHKYSAQWYIKSMQK